MSIGLTIFNKVTSNIILYAKWAKVNADGEIIDNPVTGAFISGGVILTFIALSLFSYMLLRKKNIIKKVWYNHSFFDKKMKTTKMFT